MKEVNETLEPVLRLAIEKSLQNYELIRDGNFLGDLFLFYDEENQLITLFDNREKELFTLNLNVEPVVAETDDMLEEVRNTAKYVLKEMEKGEAFNRKFISKPFAVSLVDSEFIILDEFIFVDDDTLKLDGGLLEGLDKELNDFLKNLMK